MTVIAPRRTGSASGWTRTVRNGRTWLAVVLVVVSTGLPVACSSTREIDSADVTKTTIRDLGNEDLVDEDGLLSASQGAKEIQRIVDRLVASNDACAILTQKDIKGLKIDATTLASSSARQTLANGVVRVYDHVIQIVPDPAIKPSLGVQRDTFVKVLDVVERYTANPTSKEGNDQIQSLVTSSAFINAQSAVSAWTYQHCG